MDFFICHASEDKNSFVRELFEHITRHGALVFYDEYSIKLGDSITASINRGLATCNNAIIVLSKHFFEKRWTNSEMQAIFSRAQSQDLRIIIILHEIEHYEVSERYPLLADIKSINSSLGISEVTRQILEAIDFKASISYMTYPINESAASIAGFHLMFDVQLLAAGDPWRDKYIFEAGCSDAGHSKVSLRIAKEQFLVFSVTDTQGCTIEIRADCSPIRDNRSVVIAVLSQSRASLELYINGHEVASLTELPKGFLERVNLDGGAVVFNSLDLLHPCGARLAANSIGAEMTTEQISGYTSSMEKFHNDLAVAKIT